MKRESEPSSEICMLILVKSKHGGSSGMRSWNYQKWFSMSSHMVFHSSSQWASPKAALFNLAALRQLFSFFYLSLIQAANGQGPKAAMNEKKQPAAAKGFLAVIYLAQKVNSTFWAFFL